MVGWLLGCRALRLLLLLLLLLVMKIGLKSERLIFVRVKLVDFVMLLGVTIRV